MDEFARKGYHRTAVADIAEAAGVTKPVLYQHFPSKEQLFLEVLRDIAGKLEEAILDATSRAVGPRQQVEQGFRAFFRFVAERPSRFGILFSEATREIEAFRREVEGIEAALSEAIARLIVVEGIDDERRRLLAYGIVGMAEVTCRRWIAGEFAPSDAEGLAAQLADLAWRGLRGLGNPHR
ncbi:MAG: TetR family transcriptional regulator [Acidimicrobiales bacterium]|nr:MAG: TetR family transcriptional regulator [Acidimicrobiales bacterium]